VTEMVELLLPGSFNACVLSLAHVSGTVRPRWHSTVSTPLLDVQIEDYNAHQ